MPDLQLHYSETPSWLKNDAVESNFLRDVEAGQRINTQRQQLPLKLKAMQQDAQMNELKIGETIRQRDQLLEAEQAAQGLGATIAPLLDQEQPDKAVSALLSAGIRNPILFKAPQWQTMMKEAQASSTAKRAKNQLDSMDRLRQSQEEENRAQAYEARARAEKELAQSTDIQLGVGNTGGNKPTSVQVNSAELRNATNNFRLASDELANADTPESQSAAQIKFTQAKDALDSIRAAMHIDPEGAAARRAVTDTRIAQAADRLGIERVKLAKTLQEAGFALTPGTTNQLPALTPVARPLTTGALTQSQEESLSANAALTALDDSITATSAHPEAFGVQGKARRIAEQAQGQLNPNTPMETPIADTQQKASIAFARVARSLRPDSGNMSRYELGKLEQAGDVLGAEVSPQEALTKQKNLRAAVIGQELRRLEQRHAEPDANLLRKIPADELSGLLQAGLLTEAQARRWYQINRPK